MTEITRRSLLVGAGAVAGAAALPAAVPEIVETFGVPLPPPGLALGVRVRYLGTHQITEWALGYWSHKTFEPLEPWHG